MSVSAAVDTLLGALGKRRTHFRAVGIVMEERGLSPTAADLHLRKKAVVLGVSVATAAARVVLAQERKRGPDGSGT